MTDGSTGNNNSTTVVDTALINYNHNTHSPTVVQRQLLIRDDCGPQRSLTSRTMSISTSSGVLDSPTVIVTVAVASSTDAGNDDSDNLEIDDPLQNESPIPEMTTARATDSNTANFGRPLRYDEQACEAHYDERDDADDDLEKGKIRFPQNVLFGRERESKQLNDVLESSIRQESLHIVFLEGVSGVGKSALVWESLLYEDGEGNDVDVDALVVDKCNTQRNRSSSSSRIRRRRPCWIASGKYNHHSTTQPFTAIVQSLELLAASIVAEATKALEETDGFQDQPIVTISHRFTSWYDSDDAATLISFCPSIELVQAALKKLYKRSRSTSQRHHRHRNRTENWMNNINYKHECRLSPKPSVLQRRSTGGSSQNHSDNNSSRDISETSSLLSEDESNSATDQSSLAAANDIQQLALALKSFLHCLTMPSRPLIWFLDDLQWADDCSVQLIQNILVASSTSATSGPIDEKEAVEEGNQILSHSETEKDLVIMLNGQNTNNPIIGLFVGAYRPISSFKTNDSRQPPCDHDDKVASNHSQQKENNGETSLQNMLDRVTKAVPTTTTMRVTNLTPKAIVDFCCTTLDIEEEEGWPLTNALYSATMGNIFHCRQALEHLVRNNFLYYDVMFFSWSYNLPEDGSVLQDVVEKSCQDVLELVQSKLQSCSELVRAILIRAAYTENTVFGAMLLLSLLQATGYPELTQSHMREALDEATDEGVLLNITWGSPSSGEEYDGVANHPFHSLRYKFSHDKVKEAAYNLLPKFGHERERVLLPLSTVLIQWALQASPSSAVSTDRQPSDGGLTSVPYTVSKPVSPSANQDWMWFIGVQHLNSIPIESILGTASDSFQVSKSFTLPSIEINRKRLAQWNMRVAELSIAHSSYKEAIKFLKAAISCLEPDEMWRVDGPYYKLSLQLYNKLMEISVAQGEFEETKDAIAIVMTKAGSLYDKIVAFSTKIQLAVKLNDRNIEFGIKESLNVLPLFGIKITSQPSAVDVVLEKMKFKMELQGRPLSVMGELDLILPRDSKGDLMMLLAELFHMLLLAKNHQYSYLTEIVALRGMRWTLENGISQRFPLLLSYYSAPLRSKGELNTAGKYAAIIKRLFQRFAEESGSSVIRSSEFLFCEFILHAGMLPLQNHPLEDSLENFIDIYRHSLARGAADSAMSSAMHYPLTYFVCGRPLNALLDAKLVLFQDKALQLQMPGYVALFYCARQVLYNLQGKNHGSAATAIPGETQVLSTLEGRMKNMTERDFAIYRMVLAVIFGDLDCMEKLMNFLEDTPLFDLSFARQILRVTFCGLAAYLLVRDGRSPKKNLKIASEIVKDLKKLDRADGSSSREAGSVNFRPIVLCLAALEANTVAKYDIAIAACGKRQLLHLEAFMCEQAGLLCLSRSNLAGPITPGVKTRKTTRKRDSDPNQEQTTNTVTKGVGSLTMVSTEISTEIEEGNLGRQFLGKAMWLYQDWNATAKVCQLKQRFPFLKNLTRRAAGIMPSSASSIGSLYSNESVRSKSQGTRPSTYFPVENHLGRSSECDSIYTAESNQD